MGLFKVADGIRDTTTSNGPTTLTVSGSAPSGSRTFSAELSVGDTCPVSVFHQSANEWSIALATYSATNELTLATPLKSSNANAAVTFSAGTKDVILGWPAEYSLVNGPEDTIASATTTDIGASSALRVAISGTTTITGLGTVANAVKLLRFTGALTFTHNGTSLILPGAVDITTAAGDTCIAASDASGNWRIYGYQNAGYAAFRARIGARGSVARVTSQASASSITTDADSYDEDTLTALAANLTINAPTGTPTDGQSLMFAFKDNGTARTLTWNSAFVGIGVTIPTTTVISKWIYVGVKWNAAASKWHAIAVAAEA